MAAIRFLLVLLAVLGPTRSALAQQGTISGTVVDANGDVLAHVHVRLSLDGRAPDQDVESGDGGGFFFSNVVPGPFRLALTAPAFAGKEMAGELGAGEALRLPSAAMALAAIATEVHVTPAQVEIAEAQIKVQEKQRLLGLLPNYFVNYDPDAAPLNAEQKFELTWKGFLDPSAFVVTGLVAAIGQAQHTRKGFGDGAEGYVKRYGAAYAESVTFRLIDKVAMPTIFRQDPRYFYKGTGTSRARAFYAISRSVVCRGDNRRDQLCYSRLISRFAAGFLANLYFPPADRNSAGVTAEYAALGIGASAVGYLFQEFIARRLTRTHP